MTPSLTYDRSTKQKLGLPFGFESPVPLISTPVANMLLSGRQLSTTGNFTRSVKGKSGILSHNRYYGLRSLMTANHNAQFWTL